MLLPSMLDYQRQLIFASLDDFTPNDTFGNFCGGQYGPEPALWKSAVINFLCMGVRCGLLELTHRPDISVKRDVDKLRNLLLFGDLERDMEVAVLWNVLYFDGTQELVEIMDKCDLCNWESLNKGVSEELVDLLKKYSQFREKKLA